jgi:hypothetical protein
MWCGFFGPSHKGPVRRSHMATMGKINYLPSQVFCNEGKTTILVEMWEKMSEKLNLWKDEVIYKGKDHVMIYGNHSMLNASLYYKYMHIPTKV